MALTIRPPEGVIPSENWKNTPYTFYNTVPKIAAGTNTVVEVYEPSGTYTWKSLKEQKLRLQAEIDDINSKINMIEAENTPVVTP